MYARVNVAVDGSNMWFVLKDGAVAADLIDVCVDSRPRSTCCLSICSPDRDARRDKTEK